MVPTEHAEDQLRNRGISEADVLHILDHHHTVLPRRNKPGHVYRGEVGGRTLSVVVDDHVNPIVLITAYWHDGEGGSAP